MFWHVVDGLGANFTWPNPLAPLAVIEPDWPVVASLTVVCRPCAVSCSETLNESPWFRNRSSLWLGVPEASGSKLIGFGGPCGLPLLVRYAKLTYSTPVVAAHVEFSSCPVTGFSDRLSMLRDTHHCVAEQVKPFH